MTAKSSGSGAGIGGGGNGSTEGGDGSNITINGGSVKATSTDANAIGGGTEKAPVTPTNDSNTSVYLLKIENPNGYDVIIDGNKYEPSFHNDGSQPLYAYLTAGSFQVPHTVRVGADGGKVYYYYDTLKSRWVGWTRKVDIPAADGRTFTYTGKEQTYQIASSKDYTVSGDKQINAGTHTVTVSLDPDSLTVWTDGTPDFKTYDFVINKKAAPSISDMDLSYNWGATGEQLVQITGLPTDLGEPGEAECTVTDDHGILSGGVSYQNGEVSFALNQNTADHIEAKATIRVTLPSQNYEHIGFDVNIKLTAKAYRAAPAMDDFQLEVALQQDGTYRAKIVTGLTDVEYSFDGTTWSDETTASAGHGQTVTGYIRYKETPRHNASPAASKSQVTGHGTLRHHAAKEPTATEDGNIEYWSCGECGKYFCDAAGTKEIQLDDTVIRLTYPPEIEASEGGGAEVVPQAPQAGETVTITPRPEAGYEVGDITVTDESGKPIPVVRNDDGTYTFTQRQGKVTIRVSFARQAEAESAPPRTGDSSNVALWLAAMLACGITLTGTVLSLRKKDG